MKFTPVLITPVWCEDPSIIKTSSFWHSSELPSLVKLNQIWLWAVQIFFKVRLYTISKAVLICVSPDDALIVRNKEIILSLTPHHLLSPLTSLKKPVKLMMTLEEYLYGHFGFNSRFLQMKVIPNDIILLWQTYTTWTNMK